MVGIIIVITAIGMIGKIFMQPATNPGSVASGTPSIATENASMPNSLTSKDSISSSSILFPQPGQTSLSVDRKIIKSAYLSIIVDNLRTRTNELQDKAKALGGFASSSSITTLDDGTENANLTLRVPADKADTALKDVRAIATRIVTDTLNNDDTTDQLVDIEARLKALHESDDQYGQILKQATNVDDILKITQTRNDVRQQIEQLNAQQESIQNQVAFSTISVSMSTETGLPGQPTWRPALEAKRAWQVFIRASEGTLSILIVGLVSLPLVLAWLGIAWLISIFGWRLINWLRKILFRI